MTRRYAWIVVTALALSACVGKQQAATPAADTTVVAPAVVDSAAPVAADSAAKPAATTKAPAPKKETGDYDQTIKPRFKVDEKTGKVDTIRKP